MLCYFVALVYCSLFILSACGKFRFVFVITGWDSHLVMKVLTLEDGLSKLFAF